MTIIPIPPPRIEADVVAMIRKLATVKKGSAEWKETVEELLTRGDIRDCFDHVRDQMHEEADALRSDLYDQLANEHDFKDWIYQLREKRSA